MRSFIGLDLSATQKLALDAWRQQALPHITTQAKHSQPLPGMPAIPSAVPVANFHITLAFLDSITARQHDALMQQLDDVQADPIELTLDSTGVWDGPKILYAAPSAPPSSLMKLAKQIRRAARAAGINLDNREYRPHVTLVRKATSATPPPLLPPSLPLQFDAFHLFESMSTQSGVQYPIRHSWRLTPNMSVREQLRQGLI